MADSKLQDLNSGTGVVTPADANFIYMEQGTTAKFCTLTVLVDAYLKAEFNFLENEAGSIAIGLTAQDSYTNGTNNTSFGVNTLTANTTGSNNTAMGKHALDANITGNQNTAVGSDAGGAQAGATDDDNTWIGFNAGLLANAGAGKNTAVGSTALDAAVTSTDATAVGYGALGASTAAGNTAVGSRALTLNVAGVRNVAMGVDAGATQAASTDNDNTWIGNLAGNVASSFGFNVTDTGIGTNVVNVGDNGAAFSVANGTDLTIMQLLLATNSLTDQPDSVAGFASIYDENGDGMISSAEAALRAMANIIYSDINEQGDF